MQQHRVAPLNRVYRLDQQVCGHALQERRGADIEGDTVGQSCDEIGWCKAIFGVGALSVRRRHPIAHPQTGDAVADRFDSPGDLRAEHKRQLVRIQP
jgi:hypothetical protein